MDSSVNHITFPFTYPLHKLMCLGVQRTPFQAIRWLMITFGPDIKEMKAFTGIIDVALIFASILVSIAGTVTMSVIY